MFIPKEERSEKVDRFRIISLLSVESKNFFSVVAKRLTRYLLNNNYIDISVSNANANACH